VPDTGASTPMRSRSAQPLSNAYELFILTLTILSLGIMVLLLVPLPAATHTLLTVYDNLICVVFLGDFALRIRRASSASQYFVHERGWLDLLGSIPSLGLTQYGTLLRLARLSRLARIGRLLRGKGRRELLADVVEHRGQYAAFITFLAGLVVLVISSVLVLTFEAKSSQANITTGGDALWWGIVTITTVGYGDFFPVTAGGRITAFFVMLTGVGIIGSLASILASLLVGDTSGPGTDGLAPDPAQGIKDELAAIRAELSALRGSIGDAGAVPRAAGEGSDG
jgi:voltage-gated potassium channel